MSVFTAACIQMRSGTEPQRNIETFETLVREAAGRGARYIQTPEMTGAVQRDRKALMASIRPQDDDPLVRRAADLARELSAILHVGSTPIAVDGERVANRAFVFGPDGALLTTYDKIHMFDVDLDNGESWRESNTYRAGDCSILTRTAEAAIGLSICYDLRFPYLFRRQALAGADMLTAPAAFTRQTGEAHWHVLLRARAIENGAFMVAAAQGGTHEDGRETYGHSLIVDPWGRILAEKNDDEPGIVTAEIDTGHVGAARQRIPNLANGREAVELRLAGQGGSAPS